MLDRIEYLASKENAEDGGDIPATASIESFLVFYFDNPDLGEPLLGTTPNEELQAMWAFSDGHRLVAEFLVDDTVRCVYRQTTCADSSKRFIMNRQPRHRVRSLLEADSI